MAAILSVQAAPGGTLSEQWCDIYRTNCQTLAGTACGAGNTHASTCSATFENNVCTDFNVTCFCTTANGATRATAVQALQMTFSGTNGACSALPTRVNSAIPSAPTSVAPPTGSVAPPASSGAPVPPSGAAPDSSSPKKDNAGHVNSGSIAMTAAAAVGAVIALL
ncbi:hypothetical protein BGZ94_008124 [Podila epigama]|nr:hypothetical protein BGZ94_008124 [Podila epigama]